MVHSKNNLQNLPIIYCSKCDTIRDSNEYLELTEFITFHFVFLCPPIYNVYTKDPSTKTAKTLL